MKNTFITLVILFFGLCSQHTLAQETANLPITPYINGLDELKNLKTEKAKKWFGITATEYASTEFALQSYVLKSMLLLSEELSYLKLVKIFDKALKQIKIGNLADNAVNLAEVESMKSEAHGKLRDIQGELLSWGKELSGFRERLKSEKVHVTIALQIADWDTEFLISKLGKKGTLSKAEQEELFLKELTANLLGLCAQILAYAPERGRLNTIDSDVNLLELATAFGIRLYLAGVAKESKEMVTLAKQYFEFAKDVSEKDKYHKTRLVAVEYLEKIEKKLKELANLLK